MNAGKIKYDNIPIPDGLERAIEGGIRRGVRRNRLKAVRRAAAGVAAAVLVLFAGANIMPVYSYAAELPVLGEIVRVLHIGAGGGVTDGAEVQGEVRDDIVELSFTSREGGTMTEAPAYTVEHLYAPGRAVLTIHGVRGSDFESIRSSLMSSEAVADVYRGMYLDDSAISITVVLAEGRDFEITEYADPGTLVFRFHEAAENPGEVYYLRTEAMDYSEQLGLLCEEYHAEGASQVKTASGKYIVAIGQYATEAEAAAALETLEASHGDGAGFYVASGGAYEVPAA